MAKKSTLLNNNLHDVKCRIGMIILNTNCVTINGDPDNEGLPRVDDDGYGIATPVSLTRKVKEIVRRKDEDCSLIWQAAKERLNLDPDENYQVFMNEESGDIDLSKYWDLRLFGLGPGINVDKHFPATLSIGLGKTVGFVEVEKNTITNINNVDPNNPDKERGMAPDGYSYIKHGLYVFQYIVSGSRAYCSQKDIELFLELLPFAYVMNNSLIRSTASGISYERIWDIEINIKGLRNPCAIWNLLAPTLKEDVDEFPKGIQDYIIPEKTKDIITEITNLGVKEKTNIREIVSDNI